MGNIGSHGKIFRIKDLSQGDLRSSGEVRLFKLGSEASEFCIVFTEDYKSHVLKFTSDLSISKAVIGKSMLYSLHIQYLYKV